MQIILIEGIYIECLPNILDHHEINDDFLYLQMYQKIFFFVCIGLHFQIILLILPVNLTILVALDLTRRTIILKFQKLSQSYLIDTSH